MARIKRSRPSPALIVAVLALVAALAGTAIADPVANTAVSKKKTKKIAKKQAKKYFNNNIGDASVANAENAENATNAENAATAESANTVDGPDAANLTQGFATVNDGINPAVRNFGGKRIDSVTVDHPANTANYNWTFTGDFTGVTANQVGAIASTYDSDTFVWCAGNNDTPPPVVTDTTLTLRTFCTLNAANTIVSEAHTVEIFIGG